MAPAALPADENVKNSRSRAQDRTGTAPVVTAGTRPSGRYTASARLGNRLTIVARTGPQTAWPRRRSRGSPLPAFAHGCRTVHRRTELRLNVGGFITRSRVPAVHSAPRGPARTGAAVSAAAAFVSLRDVSPERGAEMMEASARPKKCSQPSLALSLSPSGTVPNGGPRTPVTACRSATRAAWKASGQRRVGSAWSPGGPDGNWPVRTAVCLRGSPIGLDWNGRCVAPGNGQPNRPGCGVVPLEPAGSVRVSRVPDGRLPRAALPPARGADAPAAASRGRRRDRRLLRCLSLPVLECDGVAAPQPARASFVFTAPIRPSAVLGTGSWIEIETAGGGASSPSADERERLCLTHPCPGESRYDCAGLFPSVRGGVLPPSETVLPCASTEEKRPEVSEPESMSWSGQTGRVPPAVAGRAVREDCPPPGVRSRASPIFFVRTTHRKRESAVRKVNVGGA